MTGRGRGKGGNATARRLGGEAALSVEARYLEPELPIELDDAYQQTFDRLRRLFRARGCSPEESADLAQEAAVRAFMHIRRWGVASSGLDPLLNRIARNLLIDRYRRTSPHLVPLDSADEIQDPAQDPTEEVARRQRRSAVRSAIRSLPTRHQKAISYSLSGLTPEEVGKEMGIGRNAADALLHRARRSLREHLAPVKDGMWGVAIGFKVRLSRATRKLGLNEGAGDALRLSIMQSGLGVAAAAVMTVAAVGGGSGLPPRFSNSRIATHGVAMAVSHGSENDSALGSTSGAASSDTTNGVSGVNVGVGDVSNTHWGDGFNHHTGVPSPPGQTDQPEIIGIDIHAGSRDGESTTDRRLQSSERFVCRSAPRACWS